MTGDNPFQRKGPPEALARYHGPPRTLRQRTQRAMAALAAAAALSTVVTGPAAFSAAPAVEAGTVGSYIVRAVPGGLAALREALTSQGLRLGRQIPIIDAVVVELPASRAASLLRDPRVASVTENAGVRLLVDSYVPGQDSNSMYNLTNMVGSRGWWSKHTGAGVDVALIDSGVTPVVGLAGDNQVINGPDLSPESQSDDTRYLDTFGHGTHMAGIIAGRDPGVVPATSSGNSKVFLGVAPDARIVSVKVADARGNTDVSQVIAAIGWVVQHAKDPGMNIRVLNLSFGTDSTQAYDIDPLAYATEVAWRAGIVVITSAGNSGSANGRLANPASNPYVIAVGADNLNGSSSVTDDSVPAFSSKGDGKRNPDLVAPGVSVQSLRVPGSYIDTQFSATGGINERFFRGSGTSQSAAFLSGCAALLLQKLPTLTPDQVKSLFMSTTSVLPKTDATAQGKGLVNMRNVAGAKLPGLITQKWVASTGLGSLNAARGSAKLELDGVLLDGEVDLFGNAYDSAAMASALAAGNSWAGGTWNGNAWAGNSWAGKSWAGTVWAGKSWAGTAWAGKTWASGTWNGSTWAGSSWAGNAWAGSSWAGSSWAGNAWAGTTWAGASWS